jgi:peptidoglycan/LPS O-acetylase OafA/YrhL
VTLETNSAVTSHGVETHPRGVRLNNVAELRLLFASSVMLSHSALLANPDGYRVLRTLLNSEASVQGFFILSGFLVCGSFSRIGDPLVFYKRRLLRIYPAYLVAVLLFLALGLGQAMLRGIPIAWGELPRYLAANLTTLNFLQPTVGGVFAGNPMPAINGALWSIKVELMFYALLPLLYAIGQRISLAALAALLIAGGALYWPVLNWLGDSWGMAVPLSLKFQLPGQIHYFGIGIALFARSRGQISNFTLLALIVWALALLMAFSGGREAIQALVLVAIIGGGTVLPQVRDVFGGQDISYGVYLSHFPTIQLLLAAGMGAAPFGLYLACVVVIAVAYGIASWRLIERPALAWSRR